MTTAAQPIRVLIVEDHELARTGVCKLLADEPDIQIVAAAASGGEALAQAQALRPDVVLLDARLSDMPGPEVCQAIVTAVPAAAVAVLTAFQDDELVRSCVRAGAMGFLLKDIARLELARCIRILARGEPVFDQRVLTSVMALARRSATAADAEPPVNDRQRHLLQLVADGLTNREIAEQLHLSQLTIKSYIEELLKQLGAKNRVHAASLALRRGWL